MHVDNTGKGRFLESANGLQRTWDAEDVMHKGDRVEWLRRLCPQAG